MATTVAFSVCLLVGSGVFVAQLWGRFRLLRAARPAALFDRIPERMQAVLVYAFGQRKFVRPEMAVVRERSAGWMHFFIFWGFVVLGLHALTMFGRAYSDHFHVPLFSPGLLGGPYMVLRDLMEVATLAGIGWAFFRWFVTRPLRLFGYAPAENRLRGHSHGEAYFILGCIGTIMIDGLLSDGARQIQFAGDPLIAAEGPWEIVSRPLGLALAGVLASAATI